MRCCPLEAGVRKLLERTLMIGASASRVTWNRGSSSRAGSGMRIQSGVGSADSLGSWATTMMPILSTDSAPAVAGWKRGREFAAESWQQQNERAISEPGGAFAERKRGREVATETWQQHCEKIISESIGVCKLTSIVDEGEQARNRENKVLQGSTHTLAVCSEMNCKDTDETYCKDGENTNCKNEGATNHKAEDKSNCKDEGATTCKDEGEKNCKDENKWNCKDEDNPNCMYEAAGVCDDLLDMVGVDLFKAHILPRLDSRSLARSAAVSTRWRPFALADNLWQPLLTAFLTQRAHLPLCLMDRGDWSTSSSKQHLLYTIAMTESRQKALVAGEMCRRTWELRLKLPCGPYWLAFDPTQVGKSGLNRYFCCDGSLISDPGDPIWGGHACEWKFVRLEDQNSSTSPGSELLGVRINHWPPLAPRREKDGRWVLENFYALYITRPDNPAFLASDFQGHKFTNSERRRLCRNACAPPVYGFQS